MMKTEKEEAQATSKMEEKNLMMTMIAASLNPASSTTGPSPWGKPPAGWPL